MAPALTEPISPTEKLSSTAASASGTPATRSSCRKLEPINIKSNNNNTILKQSQQQSRDKRNCNGTVVKSQTPTSSSLRSTRSRLLSADTNSSRSEQLLTQKSLLDKAGAQHTSTTAVKALNNTDTEANEQMGLSTANAENNKNISTSFVESVKKDSKEEDTSTAQLLADLTNEAITAEICLRNQLKDVNLVKVSEGNSSPLQQRNDIVVLKAASVASPPTAVVETKKDIAHMEARSHESESKSSSSVQKYQSKEHSFKSQPSADTSEQSDIIEEEYQRVEQTNEYNDTKAGVPTDRSETIRPNEIRETKERLQEDCSSSAVGSPDTDLESNANDLPSAVMPDEVMEIQESIQDSPIGSPELDSEAKRHIRETTKPEIHEVQELPPVNTDSTMTASEVEDNLEERLSQLDGTAIDSPPPNHDVDMDATIKETENVDSCTTTPPRTPTHQQSLSQDLQQIQQQLQNTPPTPVSQQVQSHHMQQQQPQNCFTPQSTTSSVNSLGSGNIPQSFIKESEGGGAELEDQDIEEVFKVLKGFEGGTTSDLNVCDLNVLFNEVYMKMNETEIGSHSGSGGPVGVVQSSTNAVNPSIQLVKPTELEEGQLDIEKRQQQMQRKIDFLTRRLRKQQSRYMCKHTSEEVGGLFEWSSRHASKGGTHNTHTMNSSVTGISNSEIGAAQDPSKYFLKVIAARPPASDWKDVQEASLPATQITALLRKLELVANAQQLRITPATTPCNITTSRKSKKALTEAQSSSSTSASSYLIGKSKSTVVEGRADDVIVSTFEENVTDELTQVAGLLQSEMCEVQRAIDSDATESSSGGESADEMVTYNNQQQQSLPITKRAAWRYSRDRAAIASRWSWLLSQISDLEIKIRQHSELHQEIVRSKGPVVCQAENGPKIDMTKLNESEKEELLGSCRTRGYVTTQFRKRKLIQTTNIHTISKKAARPSSIKCGCQWPLHPCALCTGRSDPTAPRDLPDTMMMSDRIALLDSGYHPVLSFKDNVNNALHFEAIAKQSEWQQRVMRCQAKNIAKNVWRAERDAVAAATGGGGHHSSSSKKGNETAPTKRRYIKKKDRVVNEDKSVPSTGSNSSAAMKTEAAVTAQLGSVSSVIEAGNGTATLTTTSTTPLVANKVTGKSAKNPSCRLGDRILKEPATSLPHNSSTSSTNLPIATTSTLVVHQTSNCLPTNYDQYNLNQIPSSLISNNQHSSKSNKHRKNSSASVAANSHQYNHYLHHNNNHLYNGDSNYYTLGHDWAAGGIDGTTAVKSRTSSPTHGISSNSNYHKYERSLDRKNRTSYDIDNIVIPYSVAAATRVEILPYKEIPTPKWRLVEIESDETTNKVEASDTEESIKASTTNGHLSYKEILKDLKKAENLTDNRETNAESNDAGNEKLKENNDKTKNNNKTITAYSNYDKSSDSKNDKEMVDTEADNTTTTLVEDGGIVKEPDSKKIKIESSNVIKSQTIETSFTESEISDSVEEDISDDAMVMRHERALTEERRKFQTYLKFPWSTRSRANRRIDSRAESSGANTPDPSSPASHTPCVGAGDQESIPSPSNPSTPLTPLDTISEAGDNSTSFLGVGSLTSACLSKQRQERRRTTSTKRDRELERRSSTPDSKELIPPYEPMKFPLSNEQLDELMRAMPLEHNTESKRFDECYLPGGVGPTKPARSAYGGGYTSKRSSRSSTLCGGDRRIKGSNKNISADDAQENGSDFLYDEEYDDYPKHHLAPNDDDHLTADNSIDPGGTNADGNDDIYGDSYDAFSRTQKHRRNELSDGESTETEPFQDDDPNDPEWRGEVEDRSRKKI